MFDQVNALYGVWCCVVMLTWVQQGIGSDNISTIS